MQIGKPILKFLVLISLVTLQACVQQKKMTIYKGDKFILKYPAQWQTTDDGKILNFFPRNAYGALTISHYPGIDFPLDKTKDFVMEMNEIKDDPANVKVTTKGDVTEFYYEHIDQDLQWVTKAVRKNTDFYLLTINCQVNKWNMHKDTLLKVLNSFKIN